MNIFILASLATGAAAQWWGGAPDCAVSPLPYIHKAQHQHTDTLISPLTMSLP